VTLSWQVANRVASIAAAQAHDELGVDLLAAPIDVAAAIAAAGVELMYRPLPGLFGAYLADAPLKGILINNRMPRAVRRHTAAHELGHHRLGHGTVYDPGATEGAAVMAVAPGAPDVERTAEAFATWFLMPLRTVRAALEACGFTPPFTAAQVYQLSLRLGTTYAATARHLVSLRLADRQQSRQWAAVTPGRLKRQLAGEEIGSTLGVDVWDLAAESSTDGAVVASSGDLLVLNEARGTPEVDGCEAQPAESGSGTWIVPVEPTGPESVIVVRTPPRQVTVHVAPRPMGRYMAQAEDIDGV
jgi:Zn-dependent peptidase ImmA (M78 family)